MIDFATLARDALARIAAGEGTALPHAMADEFSLDRSTAKLIELPSCDVAVAIDPSGGFRVAVSDYEAGGVHIGRVAIDG